MLQDVEKKDMDCISPFPLLTKDAVESLRYRAQVCNIFVLDYIFDFFSKFYISVSVHSMQLDASTDCMELIICDDVLIFE